MRKSLVLNISNSGTIKLSINDTKLKVTLAYINCTWTKYNRPFDFYKYKKEIKRLIGKEVFIKFINIYSISKKRTYKKAIIYDENLNFINYLIYKKKLCPLSKETKFLNLSHKRKFLSMN